jgi:hypothetical protein
VKRRRVGGSIEIDLKPDEPLAPLLAVLEAKRARVHRIQLHEGGDEGSEVRIEVRTPPGVRGRDLVDELQGLDEVRSVRWDE